MEVDKQLHEKIKRQNRAVAETCKRLELELLRVREENNRLKNTNADTIAGNVILRQTITMLNSTLKQKDAESVRLRKQVDTLKKARKTAEPRKVESVSGSLVSQLATIYL